MTIEQSLTSDDGWSCLNRSKGVCIFCNACEYTVTFSYAIPNYKMEQGNFLNMNK